MAVRLAANWNGLGDAGEALRVAGAPKAKGAAAGAGEEGKAAGVSGAFAKKGVPGVAGVSGAAFAKENGAGAGEPRGAGAGDCVAKAKGDGKPEAGLAPNAKDGAAAGWAGSEATDVLAPNAKAGEGLAPNENAGAFEASNGVAAEDVAVVDGWSWVLAPNANDGVVDGLTASTAAAGANVGAGLAPNENGAGVDT